MIQHKTNTYTKQMYRRFLIPSLTSAFFLSLSNIVDSLVIGQRMQENGLAAFNLVLPIYMVFNMLDVGLAIGGSLTYTRLLGEGKVKEARSHFSQILLVALALSFLIAVCGQIFLDQILWILGCTADQGAVYTMTRDYAQILLLSSPLFFLSMVLYEFIRIDNGTVIATIGFVAGGAIDIILNFVLVLGTDMGVRGAIYATVIGKLLSVIIYNTHFLHKESVLRFQIGKLKLKELLQSFRVGFADSNKYLLQFVFLLTANQILMRFYGETAVAVLGFILNVNYVVLSFFDGTLASMQPLVTTFTGEHDPMAAKDVTYRSFLWATVLTTALSALAALFAPQLCEVFGITDAESLRIGTLGLRLFLLSVLVSGWNMLLAGYVQAIGKEKWCYLMTFLRNFAVQMPCLIVFSTFNSLSAFWWMFLANEAISLIIWIISYKRHNKHNSDDESDRILRLGLSESDNAIGKVLQETEAFCEKWEANMKQVYYVTLTVEEICTAIQINAFGKQNNRKKDIGLIQITLIAGTNGDFELHLRDNAKTYNPFDAVTKQIVQAENADGIDAIGILMVKKKAKNFFYRRYLGFNVLVITV